MGHRVFVLSGGSGGSPRVLIGQKSVLKPCGWIPLSEKSNSMDTTFSIGYTGRNAYDRVDSWISLNKYSYSMAPSHSQQAPLIK